MSRTIDSADRITDRVAVTNPADKSSLSAANMLIILDGIVNGKYRSKPYQATYAEIEALSNKEPGEIFYATDTDQYIGYDMRILG